MESVMQQMAHADLELPRGPVTDEQIAAFCARHEGLRVERDVNGELIVMSPAFSDTSGSNAELTTELMLWTRADGRGKAFDSSGGFTLPDGSMRNPDASWMLLSRWNSLAPEQKHSFAPLCPDFVIELRSTSDGLPELRAKMTIWIANRAQVAWLIDPQRRVVEVYRAGEAVEVYENPSSVQGSGCVSGFCLVMERVWGRE
jgi:Uma2 family endonuclease